MEPPSPTEISGLDRAKCDDNEGKCAFFIALLSLLRKSVFHAFQTAFLIALVVVVAAAADIGRGKNGSVFDLIPQNIRSKTAVV